MNSLESMENEYLLGLEKKGYEDGYLKVDRMFIEIGRNQNHELSLDSALEFVEFFGYRELINWNSGKRAVVAKAAFDCLGSAIEKECLKKRNNF